MVVPELDADNSPAGRRAAYLSALLWHTGTFVITNAFFWALDLIGGGGVRWSVWITLGWGLALAFHALAYFVDGRGLEALKTREYLAQEARSHRTDETPPGDPDSLREAPR